MTEATSATTQATTHTLDVPGAVLTYDLRKNESSTKPVLLVAFHSSRRTTRCT